MNDVDGILAELRRHGSEAAREGMARYGINVENALGVSIGVLRELKRGIGADHRLALALWATGVHEARILASFIDIPARVTGGQMDRWARDFDSWDLCDQCCIQLFRKTPFAWDKAVKWTGEAREYVRRAGFALIATLGVHEKMEPDATFLALLPLIEAASMDERNGVKKAVNWALRQIGKRNAVLHAAAMSLAEALAGRPSRSARWIGRDALRELRSEAVLERIGAAGSGRV